MNRETVKNKLLELVEELTDIPREEIQEDSGLLDDLELSSFEVMSMFSDLEDAFDILIPENEIRNFVTVGDVINCICSM